MLHILQTVKELTDRGVTLVSTTDGIDSSTPAGRMMIGVLGSLAEYERELIRERTALKRASSRANGTKFGRPRKVDDSEHITTAKRTGIPGRTSRSTSGSAMPPGIGISPRMLPRERASLAAYVPAGVGKCLIVLYINIDSHSAKTPAGRCCT